MDGQDGTVKLTFTNGSKAGIYGFIFTLVINAAALVWMAASTVTTLHQVQTQLSVMQSTQSKLLEQLGNLNVRISVDEAEMKQLQHLHNLGPVGGGP